MPADFRRAIERGDVAAVSGMLDRQESLLRATDEEGRSAFILAHLANQTAVAQLFTDRGLELGLVEAVLAQDRDRVNELGKAHFGLADEYHAIGGSAMYAAARYGRTEVLFWTKRWGALPNTNRLGDQGMTPVRAGLEVGDVDKARKIAFSLLGDGGDTNAPQKDNDTVLHAAVRLGDPQIVRLVLRKRARLDVRNAAGRTPLEVAVSQGRQDYL